jgi:uncharacterized membrane protein
MMSVKSPSVSEGNSDNQALPKRSGFLTSEEHNMNEKWNSLTKVTKVIIIAPIAILGMAIFIMIGGTIVMLLWNGLAPNLFGVPVITFWQALGLLVLCRILFGGFGMRGGQSSQSRKRASERIADRVAERVSERLESMTPEERERFRQRVRERWDAAPPSRETSEL